MTLGSLFDGSGGFPLAGALCGITPMWASEIEAYPLKVTKKRFPKMKHLGDVTKIDGGNIYPVDIITFGSPCQDLSVAGQQKGIYEGARSNLFFEAVRIIREMRDRDARAGRSGVDVRPRYAVWENVTGAFSSGGGSDFAAVLETLARVADDGISIPRPPRSEWSDAGCVVGNGWSIAWRVYDAQYWGVPQRRKRIYLVADFGSERAAEILFERESLPRNPEPGEASWQGIADDAAGGAGGGGNAGCLNPWDAQAQRIYGIDGPFATLQAQENSGLNRQGVCYPNIARSLCARGDSSPCVDRGMNVVAYDARGNGGGQIAPTITGDHNSRATDYTALCVGNGQMCNITMQPVANTLDCMHDQQAVINPGSEITSPQNRTNPQPGDPAPTLTNDNRNLLVSDGHLTRKYIVRRLTPLECCRLQGFPDWWEDGVAGSDTARYKMWGNGIALPCAYDVLSRIAKEASA